jgi:hypothetical protein
MVKRIGLFFLFTVIMIIGWQEMVWAGLVGKSNWRIVYVDSEELSGENGDAENAFDAKSSSHWHTEWRLASPPPPHEIQIDLGMPYRLKAFRYLPRQDGGVNGRIGRYEFYVSTDGANWGNPAASGVFANDASEKEVSFTPNTGRFVRLKALSEVNGRPWTSMAELSLIDEPSAGPSGTFFPEWLDVHVEPFDLKKPLQVVNPVLTAQNVTDVPAAFVADPFLFYENGTWYMFFEVYRTDGIPRGVIGLARSYDGYVWEYDQIVLSETFHVSYPMVFKFDNKYYMLLETANQSAVRLYEAARFPYGWTRIQALVSGKAFVDPQLFRYNDKWWLFVGDTSNSNCYLYYSSELTSGWREHPASPIVRNDRSKARGGGRSFVFNNNQLIRIAQKCDLHYGESVRAFKVYLLTEREYGEQETAGSPLLQIGREDWNRYMHQFDPWWDGRTWICAIDGHKGDGLWKIGIYEAGSSTRPGPGLIPKTDWSLVYVDSEERLGESGAAGNGFDGTASTHWHTEWRLASPPPPHEIQIDLGTQYLIEAFRYLPRQDGGVNGRIGQYEFYVSADGINWGSPAASGTFANDAKEKEVMLSVPKAGQFVRLKALREVNGRPWTSMAELSLIGSLNSSNLPPSGSIELPSSDVSISVGQSVVFTGSGSDPDGNLPLQFLWQFGAGSGIPDMTVEDPGAVQFNTAGVFSVSLTVTDSLGYSDPTPATRQVTVSNSGGSLIPKNRWILRYVDSEERLGESGAAGNGFDGTASTHWHTEWRLASPPPPHEIQIDLGTQYLIEAFRYLPRQDGGVNGRIGQYEFYVSADGINWDSPAASGTFANDAKEKEVMLSVPKAGQFVRLKALREVNGRPWTSMAELSLIGSLN